MLTLSFVILGGPLFLVLVIQLGQENLICQQSQNTSTVKVIVDNNEISLSGSLTRLREIVHHTCDVRQWKYRSRNKQVSYKDKILSNFSPRLFWIPMKRDMIGYQHQGSEPRNTCAVPGGPWHWDNISRLITLGKLLHDNWHCPNMF